MLELARVCCFPTVCSRVLLLLKEVGVFTPGKLANARNQEPTAPPLHNKPTPFPPLVFSQMFPPPGMTSPHFCVQLLLVLRLMYIPPLRGLP